MNEQLQIVFKALVEDGTFHSCLNCAEWSENYVNPVTYNGERVFNRCMRYSQTPPAEVIVFGCDNWLINIPF